MKRHIFTIIQILSLVLSLLSPITTMLVRAEEETFPLPNYSIEPGQNGCAVCHRW